MGKSTGLGCNNCVNGWVLYEKPAETVKIDGKSVYGDRLKGVMIEFASPCPVCNNGQAFVETLQRRSDIPVTFYDVDIENFNWKVYGKDTSMQQKIVRSWVTDNKRWKKSGMGLYIWSQTRGSGKTYLASAICNYMIKHHKRVTKFVNISKLIELSKQPETMTELVEADLLVLDDIGQNMAGVSWVGDLLYRILNDRGERNALTIATSNLPPGELQMDDRVVDRINGKMLEVRLPEVRVRALEAKNIKLQLLEEAGVIEKKQEKLAVKT